MSVGIPMHDGTYKTWAERAAYFEQLRAPVAEVPGVTIAAISINATPFRRTIKNMSTNSDNSTAPALGSASSAPGVLPALRIPLLAGPHLGSGLKTIAAPLIA